MPFYKKKSFSQLLNISITHIVITLFSVILLSILSRSLREEEFGIYLIIRRFINLTFPVITLNLGISLSRYNSLKPEKSNQNLTYSVSVLIICSSIFLILSIAFRELISDLLFNSSVYIDYAVPTILLLIANSFQILCMNFFRGVQNFKVMNMISFLFWLEALIVIIFVIFYSSFVQKIRLVLVFLYLYSFFILLTNLIIIIWKVRIKDLASLFQRLKDIKYFKEFISYGLKRIPTGFFLSGIFFIPVFLGNRFLTLKETAYIGLIISILRLLQLIGVPFNLMFTPKFSSLIHQKNEAAIRENSKIVIDFIFSLSLIAILIYFISYEIILIWLGKNYVIINDLLIYILPCVNLFVGYILIRGILDALTHKPYSNMITFSGFVVYLLAFIGSVQLFDTKIALIISLSISLITMGLHSLYLLYRILKLKFDFEKALLVLVWVIIVFGFCYAAKTAITGYSVLTRLVIKSLISLILIYLSYLFFKKKKFLWALEF